MSLTVEQKINLLILAGFEPMTVQASNGELYMRIIRDGIGIGHHMSGDAWAVGYSEQYNTRGYIPSDWESRHDIGDIPDELILKAVESARRLG